MCKTWPYFCIWLLVTSALGGLCLLSYVSVQQTYRQDANDPQIQLAEDTARKFTTGVQAHALVSDAPINPTQSLAPFIIIFDAQARPLASSGRIGPTIPQPPAGMVTYAQNNRQNRVTWQLGESTRLAAVVQKAGNKGYVLAARNLREVEHRESDALKLTGLAFLGLTVISSALLALTAKLWHN